MFHFFLFLVCLFSSSHCFSDDEGLAVTRIHHHLLIHDYRAACQEASQALAHFPNSQIVHQAVIKAFARVGDEKAMFYYWTDYSKKYSDDQANSELLEAMGWAVVEKGSASPMPIIRIITLMAALFSQDIKGVNVLERHLNDNSELVRKLAVKLASQLPDATLQQAVMRLLKTDPSWHVRLEAILALGSMHVHEAKPELYAILSTDYVTAEEKAAAIQSLVELTDSAERSDIERLSQNPRAGLRQLACEVISFLDSRRDLDVLKKLADDPNPNVRAAAIEAIGLMRVPETGNVSIVNVLKKHLKDQDPQTAILSAWAMTLYEAEYGQMALETWFSHESQSVRLLAAGALSACGKYGNPLISKIFDTTTDRFVRLNLALGMINQNERVDEACDFLYRELINQKERWSFKEETAFKILMPAKHGTGDPLVDSPEASNQAVCLEIFNILAIKNYPKTKDAMRRFLQDRKWGISGLAAVLLLTECDEASVDLVEALLMDGSPKVRLQAALILALWRRGDKAIGLLQEAYAWTDREGKERILEALGRIGSSTSIPFLVEKMQEPSQSLRMIAAAALLQTLYH